MKNTFTNLEQKLTGTLRPVAPRQEFIHHLGERVQHVRDSVQTAGASTWKFILLLLAGLLSLGVLVTWLAQWLTRLVRNPRRPQP